MTMRSVEDVHNNFKSREILGAFLGEVLTSLGKTGELCPQRWAMVPNIGLCNLFRYPTQHLLTYEGTDAPEERTQTTHV